MTAITNIISGIISRRVYPDIFHSVEMFFYTQQKSSFFKRDCGILFDHAEHSY